MIDNQSMAQDGKRETKNGAADPHAGPSTAKDTKKSEITKPGILPMLMDAVVSGHVDRIRDMPFLTVQVRLMISVPSHSFRIPFNQPWR